MSQSYSIYEAKARLSEIIRIVKKRRRVVLTERGVPVAEVIPYGVADKESIEGWLEKLSRVGAVIVSKERFETAPLQEIPGSADRFLRLDRD
jgi:prevent-host-death family protein